MIFVALRSLDFLNMYADAPHTLKKISYTPRTRRTQDRTRRKPEAATARPVSVVITQHDTTLAALALPCLALGAGQHASCLQ